MVWRLFLLIYAQCFRNATARNIIKGYVVEGSTFWLQIENSGFNSSVSLVALLAKKVPALDICMVFFLTFY